MKSLLSFSYANRWNIFVVTALLLQGFALTAAYFSPQMFIKTENGTGGIRLRRFPRQFCRDFCVHVQTSASPSLPR